MPIFDINNLLKGGLTQNIMPQKELMSVDDFKQGISGIKGRPSMTNFFKAPEFADERKKALMYLGKGLQEFGNNYATTGNIGAGFGAGMGGVTKHMQDVKNYNAYKPYFEKMGIKTESLNPMMGGSGFGDLSPTKIIDLQDNIENREFNRMYKQNMLDYYSKRDESKAENQQTTLANLMGYSPEFAKQYQNMVDPDGKYDFTGGKNREYLEATLKNMGVDINAPMPLAMGQTLIQNKPALGYAKQDYMGKYYELKKQDIDNKIKINEARLRLLAKRVAQGDSGAKAEYNALKNENMRLGIEQKKIINKILQDDTSSQPSKKGIIDRLGILKG